MPMFEYRCADCAAVTEFLVGVTAEDPEIVCSSCGSTNLQKQMSAISFTVKDGSRSSSKFPIAGECACMGGERSGGECGAGGRCCSA